VVAQAVKDLISSLSSRELKVTSLKKVSYLQVCTMPQAQSRSSWPKTDIKNRSTARSVGSLLGRKEA